MEILTHYDQFFDILKLQLILMIKKLLKLIIQPKVSKYIDTRSWIQKILLEEKFGLAITTIAATAFGTIILLILGEAAPKAFAVRNPEKLAFWYASTLRFLDLIF